MVDFRVDNIVYDDWAISWTWRGVVVIFGDRDGGDSLCCKKKKAVKYCEGRLFFAFMGVDDLAL